MMIAFPLTKPARNLMRNPVERSPRRAIHCLEWQWPDGHATTMHQAVASNGLDFGFFLNVHTGKDPEAEIYLAAADRSLDWEPLELRLDPSTDDAVVVIRVSAETEPTVGISIGSLPNSILWPLQSAESATIIYRLADGTAGTRASVAVVSDSAMDRLTTA